MPQKRRKAWKPTRLALSRRSCAPALAPAQGPGVGVDAQGARDGGGARRSAMARRGLALVSRRLVWRHPRARPAPQRLLGGA